MRYVRPDESILNAPVTAGTVDATFVRDWLTRPDTGYPVRTTGDLSLTVTPASSLLVDVVAVTHHAIRQAATITLGGSLSGNIATQPYLPDGIPTNWYRILTSPVNVSSIVLGVTGNTDPVIIGVFYAGLSRTLPPLYLGRRRTRTPLPPWEGEFMSMAPSDSGVQQPQRVTGTFVLTESQMVEMEDWYLSQRNGSRQSLVIPDFPTDTALLCTMDYDAGDYAPGDAFPGGSPAGAPEALFDVSVTLNVLPPVRWVLVS